MEEFFSETSDDGVISQKIAFFVTTAVRTSNPTRIYV
jgi:hypothetical protein